MARVKLNQKLLYRGFSDLPIYNFYEILKTHNMCFFFKDYLDGDDIVIEHKDEMMLIDRFKKVFQDRLDYSGDIKAIESQRKIKEVQREEAKLYRMKNTFNTLIEIPFANKFFNLFVEDLKKDGVKFKKELTPKTKLAFFDFVIKKIKFQGNKIKTLKVEYKDELEVKESNGEEFDLMKEKIILDEISNKDIDIYSCPVKEWTALVLRAKEKQEAERKKLEKIKNKHKTR